MAKKIVKLTESEYIKIVNNINSELGNAYSYIEGLNKCLNALMTGDSQGPYWNGRMASEFYKQAQKNIKNDISVYNSAAKDWETLYDRYIKLIKKNYF